MAIYQKPLNKYEVLFVEEYNGKFSISVGNEYKGTLYPHKIKRNFGKEEKEARFSIRFDSKSDLLTTLHEMIAAVDKSEEAPF